ncbi:patatin-like phospholipase family protein [Spirosoma validum]|uniref:Patatin-like phospholipase family protein n=1 Tax=Spirosoma validum TaxID=2771355 RepID=A0A927B8Y1_9BACT|nr:patatin-like phospholipase family protein [Spirosoma validum]MBD2757650.1 patatin-like phospholipase family protein [Spirosoma validum]
MTSASQPNPPSIEPLRQIGLAISGGGFRASAFGLGCLSYLDHCLLTDSTGHGRSLRESVTFMSTTSGGSFVSLLYAENLYQSKTFADTYRQLRELMDGERLLNDAMRILEDPDAWKNTPTKQRNLINAYALALTDSQRLGTTTFDPLCQPQPDTLLPHLRQICVNSTEFKNGLSFRFQNVDGRLRKGFVGNFDLHFRRDALTTIRKLRLADMMAASSCFPSGFEPLMFPGDFAYGESGAEAGLTTDELQQAMFCRDAAEQTARLATHFDSLPPTLSEVELTLKAEETDDPPAASQAERPPVPPCKKPVEFGLMDGGIDDNQGIQGLMLGDSRAKTIGKGFDTLIACDVSSPYIDDYEPPAIDTQGWRQLSVLKLTFWAAVLLIGLPVLTGTLYAGPEWRIALVTFGLTMGLLLGGGLLGLWYWLRAAGGSSTWGQILQEYGGYFFRIPFGTLWQMIAARLSSVVLLAGDVFMKQIRRLIYQQFYANKAYQNRRVTVLIYELSTKYYPVTEARNKKWRPNPEPSAALMAVAEEARTMATTLWFDPIQVKRDMRDKIIATGQFTMCYNLLAYLDDVKNVTVSPEYRLALDTLTAQLEADWKAFQDKPLGMVNRLGARQAFSNNV